MKAPAASSNPPFILRHDIDTAMLPVLLVRHHHPIGRKTKQYYLSTFLYQIATKLDCRPLYDIDIYPCLARKRL